MAQLSAEIGPQPLLAVAVQNETNDLTILSMLSSKDIDYKLNANIMLNL
jgi:hypothetical protein